MQFKEVVGQESVKQKLIGMVDSGRIPHAMMFMGPEGNGSLPMALAFAQYVQCENKQGNDSCGQCSSCTKNQKYIHPDVHFTFPVITKKSGEAPISQDYLAEWRSALNNNPYMNVNDWLQSIEAENKQGNITVRECHEIIKGVSMKTYESAYKIHIVWLAEFLKEAGNTLLKVIEEPPVNTIFILIVENVEMLLNTIVSRTQLIKINAIEDVDIVNVLLSRFEMDEGSAKRIARISEGNYNAALNYTTGDENANDKLLHRWLICCFNLKQKNNSTNVSQLLDWIEDFAKMGRENQKIFLKYALFFLRECALISNLEKSEKLDGDELKFAAGLSAKLNVEQLGAISAVISQLYYFVERNGNPKILLMSNSFKIASAFKGEDITTVESV